ncbi:MAG TPA: hypothetical protein VGU45_04500 [Microvirga sp.]|nr:hypothetical protein [Microvirga sp.]
MRMGRIAGWLLVGGLGSLAIVSGWRYYVETQVPVKLRPGGSVETAMWDRGYVAANGTWVVENGPARPLQFTNIGCFRSDNTCRAATAEIAGGNILSLETATYKVTRWSETTLIFVNNDAPCADYTYTISRANQRVVGTAAPRRNTAESCPAGEEALQLSLVDGARVTRTLEQEANARAQPVAWASLAALWVLVLSCLVRRRHEGEVAFAEA